MASPLEQFVNNVRTNSAAGEGKYFIYRYGYVKLTNYITEAIYNTVFFNLIDRLTVILKCILSRK